jgi:hypothetical protein
MKMLKVVLSFVLLFVLTTQPMFAVTKAAKVVKAAKYKITFVSSELVENNHVGNEWGTAGYVNGKEIGMGDTVELSLKPTDTIKLKALAEEDDKIPDIGSTSVTIKVSSITKATNKSINVTVTENRGRYSGNTAEWKFEFKIQKV